MEVARSAAPNGAGLSLARLAIALFTMPLRSPLLAARSNSTTGTPALAQCAAICAPMTPAPSTPTLRITNLAMFPPDISEQVGVQRHQVLAAAARGAHVIGRFRQQTGEIKARGGQLGGVERIAGIRLVERHQRHAGPEIRKDQMAGHTQEVGGGGAHFFRV